MRLRIRGGAPLVGELQVPPDKSITHRALMLAAMARGESMIEAEGLGADNLSTAGVMRGLGVAIEEDGPRWQVRSPGVRGWTAPKTPLDCGNSGTTMRLVVGMLAGSGLSAELIGDESLTARPMGRVCGPLREIGAKVAGRLVGGRELPPLRVEPATLHAGTVTLEVASAQAKSAVLLAGLGAGVAVEVSEPRLSRDHTERMLAALGCTLTRHGSSPSVLSLAPGQTLSPLTMRVPADFSSAAFWLAAATLVPNSRIMLRGVGVNPTRTGLLEVLEELGSRVQVHDWREVSGEPVADLEVQSALLVARTSGGGTLRVGGEIIPRIIDELPVLAALFCVADGRSEIHDAGELRVKESDRISETRRLLAAFGVASEETADGLHVEGPQALCAADVDVHSDHRIALTGLVLALAAPGVSHLSGFEIADISFPGVVEKARHLGAQIEVVE